MRPVVHYMMGGVHTDINGATPLAGLYAAGEVRLREHQRRQPAGLELAAGAAGLRRARGHASPPSSPRRTAGRQPGDRWRRPRTKSDVWSRLFQPQDGSGERIATLRERDAEDDGGGRRASTAPGASLAQAADEAARAAGALRPTSPSTTTAARSTPSASPRSSCRSCSTWPRAIVDSALQREESRGAHQRTDFPTRDDAALPCRIRWSHRNADGSCRVEYLPVTITRWPPGRAGLREVGLAWRTGITLQVARYRPESETARRRSRSTRCRCRKDWVVLDALNYIKDQLDGTLSFRWSCRMGICGSCGMTVNGEPKLTCATFLHRLRAGAGPRRAAAQLPGHPRSRRRDRRLHAEADAASSRGSSASEEKPLSEGEYLQTPEELDEYKQFSMCINCMLCYAACPVYGLDPKFLGPAAIALAQRYNLDSRDEGARRAAWRSSPSTRASGAAPSSASAPRSARSTSIRPAPSSATS